MITIAGSGLVGSLLALLLKKRGFEVEVFEKRADPRLAANVAGRSINLVVTSRGLFALEQAGLSNEVRSRAVPVYGRMIHSVTGETAYQAYGQADEFNLSISRDSLNRFLIEKAEASGVKFHFEHELTAIDPESQTATFKRCPPLSRPAPQQETITRHFQTLFGADGAGSRVRKHLATLGELNEQTKWLEADYKELTMIPQLKTDALHIWPRGDHMMMALANKDGSFTVTMYLSKKSFDSLKTKEAVEKLFTREFKDAIPLMPNYIDEFLNHPQGTLGTVRCDKWVIGNIALIGDAAHAIVPFFGQGMNSGFEDCTELMKLIDDKGLTSETLKDYELHRKENAKAIADMALENWIEMRDKVADQKFLLRKKVEGLLEQRHPQYKSRYGMITYTLIPYQRAQDAGRLQDEMFMELLNDKTSVEEVDWAQADRLIESCWLPYLKRHNLKIEKYPAK